MGGGHPSLGAGASNKYQFSQEGSTTNSFYMTEISFRAFESATTDKTHACMEVDIHRSGQLPPTICMIQFHRFCHSNSIRSPFLFPCIILSVKIHFITYAMLPMRLC